MSRAVVLGSGLLPFTPVERPVVRARRYIQRREKLFEVAPQLAHGAGQFAQRLVDTLFPRLCSLLGSEGGVELAAQELRLRVSYLERLAATASHQYMAYTIPKARGGFRNIYHPSRELKQCSDTRPDGRNCWCGREDLNLHDLAATSS